MRNEGFIGNSWKKSNKGKEQYQSWHIWLLLPKRLHPIVTTNNLFNENKNQSSEASKKKTHLGWKKENSRFASMRDQECRTFFEVHLGLFGKISKFRKSVQIKLVQRDNRICWKFLEIHFAVSATWFVASGLNLSIPASEKRQIYIQSHHGRHHFPTKNANFSTIFIKIVIFIFHTCEIFLTAGANLKCSPGSASDLFHTGRVAQYCTEALCAFQKYSRKIFSSAPIFCFTLQTWNSDIFLISTSRNCFQFRQNFRLDKAFKTFFTEMLGQIFI